MQCKTATVIAIVISKLLKRHSKAKRRVPAYSRTMPQIRGIVQRVVQGKLRSYFQMVREDKVTLTAGVVQDESGRVENRIGQGKSSGREDILILSGRERETIDRGAG